MAIGGREEELSWLKSWRACSSGHSKGSVKLPSEARSMEGTRRFRRGYGRVASAASSSLRLVALMKAVIGGVADPFTTVDIPWSTNRCSDFDMSNFTEHAMSCGSPLSSPCFDFSRCRDNPTVYIYDSECSLANSSQINKPRSGMPSLFRGAAEAAGVLAETYESACFFVNVDQREGPLCAMETPLWNEGRNHLMYDVHDGSRDKRGYFGSYAMQAASSQHTCYYRGGYDISTGHCPKLVFHELQSVRPDHREYFLTFKGSLHVNTHGSEERVSILNLHDDAQGVIVVEKCRHEFSHFKALAEKCDEIVEEFDKYDYSQLMNSTFGLVPAGASPGTYRLGEVMSAGCIPVIIARDYVKPFPEEVDWPSFSFTFSPEEVPYMLRTLRSTPPEELIEMQKKSLDAYWRIYGGLGYGSIVRHILDIVVRRIRHH